MGRLPSAPALRTRVGVLALQGGVGEHLEALERLGRDEAESGGGGLEVRRVLTHSDLDGLGGLILPGGESTAVGLLMRESGLLETIRSSWQEGLVLWGTCMGAVLLARNIENEPRRHLGLMDIALRRNAYGGQLDSFTEPAVVSGLAGGAFPMIFIRAPRVTEVGPGVEVLARVGGAAVACREGRLLATTFHPELSADTRFHAYFLSLVRESAATAARF